MLKGSLGTGQHMLLAICVTGNLSPALIAECYGRNDVMYSI